MSNPKSEAAQAAHLPKATPPTAQSKAFAKSAAPTHHTGQISKSKPKDSPCLPPALV